MSQHSSPARERYKAERQARRHAAAAAMRSVHAATIGKPKPAPKIDLTRDESAEWLANSVGGVA